MPEIVAEEGQGGALVVINGSPLWQIPAAAAPGDPWALACLTGSCELRLRGGPRVVSGGMFLAIATDPTGTIAFEAAQAVAFRIPDLNTLPLPGEAVTLDEVSMCVLHDVFFAGPRPWAHRLAALSLVCHQLALPPEVTSDESVSVVTICLDYMRQHLDDEISLSTLVEISGISKTQLLDRFRREHGQSPMRALTRLRMEQASDLLRQTDLTVSQIAAAVGYGELTAFTRAFARVMGRSPSTYRKDAQWLV